MRCAGGRVIGGWRPTVARAVAEAGPQRDDARQDRRQAALEAARRAHPDQGPDEQAQVERPSGRRSRTDVRLAVRGTRFVAAARPGGGVQAAIASEDNHNVTSPRRTRA